MAVCPRQAVKFSRITYEKILCPFSFCLSSVVDPEPDPQGSETFAGSGTGNRGYGSGSAAVHEPYQKTSKK
jgi:hypothetical protein